jgi:hypothetical protein
MGAGGTRTITIKFDGSPKGLIASAAAVAAAMTKVGDDTSGFAKAEAAADSLSKKLDQTAKDAKDKGSLMGGALALGLSTAAPVIGGALVAGVALGFVGVAGLVQKNNADVKSSFGDLKSQVVNEMQGASDQVVPYLVKSGHALQQEFANLGPQLHTAFSFAGPDIDILTSGVDNLASNAMPGLVTTMRNSKPIVQGVSVVLGDLGTTATTVLDDVSSHSQEFGNDLSQVGDLIKNVGSIGGSVLPGLAGGFGTTVGTLNTMLGVLKPIAPAVGDITGQLLPAVGAFKLFGLATQPLNKLGAKVAGVAGNLGGFTKNLTGSEAAGAKVITTTAKLGSALGKVGNALPLVGVGFAVLGDVVSSAGQKLQTVQQDLLAGGQAANGAVQDIAQSAPTIAHLASGFQQGEGSAKQFTDALNVATKGMAPLQRATAIYNADLNHFGANSKVTASAQKNLADASDADQRSQQRLNQALLGTNEQLSQQETALLGTVDASLGYQSAVLGVSQAQTNYTSVLKNSKSTSDDTKQALIGLQQAQEAEANAAVNAAAASHTNASATDLAKAKTDAFAASVLGMAAASNGHLSPALKTMVSGLTDAQLSAFAATGKVNGTHQAILNINGKTVKINVDGTGQAVKNANAVKTAIAGVKSKTVTITAQYLAIVKNPGASAAGSAPGLSGLLGLNAPKRALGGPAMAGLPYIVGDGGGPEIFVPRQSGRVIGTSESADILGGAGSAGGVGGWSGDLVIPIDLGKGVQQVIRISNRELVARVKAGAGRR